MRGSSKCTIESLRILPFARNKNMQILDLLSTAVGVPLMSKVVESVDSMELNCWMKRSHCCPRLRFHDTRKRRHAPYADMSRQQVCSNLHKRTHGIPNMHLRPWVSHNIFDMRQRAEHQITSKRCDPSLCWSGSGFRKAHQTASTWLTVV